MHPKIPAILAAVAIGGSLAAGCLHEPVRYQWVGELDAILLSHVTPLLIVEVHYVPPHAPTPKALADAQQKLRELTLKEEVKFLDPKPMPPLKPGENEYERAMATATAQETSPAYIQILYVNVRSPQNFSGLAIGSVAIVYPEMIHVPVRSPISEAQERLTLLHELGHVLGLVNNSIQMVTPREHPESKHHSRNPDSVMYPWGDGVRAFRHEYSDQLGWPSDFDADDVADIRAYQRAHAK